MWVTSETARATVFSKQKPKISGSIPEATTEKGNAAAVIGITANLVWHSRFDSS